MKKHILGQAKLGEVYALVLNREQYGYVRVFQGDCLGVLPVISSGIVSVERLRDHPARSFFDWVVTPTDKTEMTLIGEIPFTNSDEAWPPPRFIPPDIFKSYFKIVHQGQKRRATEVEAQGLQKAHMATPEWLKQFILDHLTEFVREAGDKGKPILTPVEEESASGAVFLEVVFRNADFPFGGRDEVEDPLAEALEKAGVGEVTGGGSGPETCNIDVELTDLDRGLKVIRDVLRKLGSPATTEIHQHSPEHVVYRL